MRVSSDQGNDRIPVGRFEDLAVVPAHDNEFRQVRDAGDAEVVLPDYPQAFQSLHEVTMARCNLAGGLMR